ncbi:MAG: ligand-binding protein SH3, partial [Candidatus Eisenbacteria bacterium]|nr:ligand-binding protein SH3 [Candidatus Eisenbacteria bacterium]
LRGGIPYATRMGMDWREAYLICTAGNFVPVIPILFFFDAVSRFLRRWRTFDRFFTRLFDRTRARGRVVEKYEAFGLILFVAIPLPVTGAWTGALAAYLFGVRRKYAIPAIAAGILIAGVVVTLATRGVLHLWRL